MVFESFKKSLGLGGTTNAFPGKGQALGSAPSAPTVTASSNTSSTKRGSATPQPTTSSTAVTASSATASVNQQSAINTRSASAPVDGISPNVRAPIAATPLTTSIPFISPFASSTPSPSTSSSAAAMAIAGTSSDDHNESVGSGTQYANETKDNYMVFELVFLQERLGMSINEYKDQLPIDKLSATARAAMMLSSAKRTALISRPIVSDVKPDSEAARNGVCIGDVIISLNRNQLTNFEDFYNFIVALGRPVTVQFYRPLNIPQVPISPSSSAISSIMRPFTSSQKDSSSKPPPPPTTAEEERAKKDAVRNAAIERAQAMEKKYGTGSSNKPSTTTASRGSNKEREKTVDEEQTTSSSNVIMSEETAKSIQKVKEGEMKIEQQLGYSPFRPHMSFTGNSVNSISTNPGPGLSPSLPPPPPSISPSHSQQQQGPSQGQGRGVAGMYRSSPSAALLHGNNTTSAVTATVPSPRQSRPSPQTTQMNQQQTQNIHPQASRPRSDSANNNAAAMKISTTSSPSPSTTIATGSSPMPMPSSAPNSPRPVLEGPKISPEEEEHEIAQMTADVDDAFAMLISLSESEQNRVKIAIQTIQKMLLNVFNHKEEIKFRSIRINNPAFHMKVGSICGGIELLLAAGYKFDCSPAEGMPLMSSQSIDNLMMTTSEKMNASFAAAASSSITPNTSSQHLFLDMNMTSNPNGEEYLVHPMDSVAERRLTYTLSRLSELIELQQSLYSIT